MDLISRQAAIDALGGEPEVWTGKDEYAQGLNNQWHYDINAIKAVPSVQVYTDEEIQKMQELEQAEIEKAFQLGREDAQEIAEENGTASPVDVCVECAYYKEYNIKRNVCFPEAYFTGFCRIHETNVNKLESCPAFLAGGAANAE